MKIKKRRWLNWMIAARALAVQELTLIVDGRKLWGEIGMDGNRDGRRGHGQARIVVIGGIALPAVRMWGGEVHGYVCTVGPDMKKPPL